MAGRNAYARRHLRPRSETIIRCYSLHLSVGSGPVSTRKQVPDLKNQIADLQQRHPGSFVYSDVASGINFRRRGLQRLLESAFEGRVRTVYVTHRDRLCRFAVMLPHSFVVVTCKHTILSSSFSNNPVQKSSWIHNLREPPVIESGNLQTTFSPLSPSLGHVFTAAAVAAEAESYKSLPTNVSRKRTRSRSPSERKTTPKGTKNPLLPSERLATYRLRLKTNGAQYRTLRDWMKAGRWAYNQAVAKVQSEQWIGSSQNTSWWRPAIVSDGFGRE